MSFPLERLAICSWSLQPKNPDELISQVKALGIPRIQLALDPIRLEPGTWGGIGERCRNEGIKIVSGMFVTEGEDYSTLDSIRRTGGLVPDATWETNLGNIHTAAKLSQELGLRLVTFHAGFMPHDPSDPLFGELLDRLRRVAGIFEEAGIDLALETGQEEANLLCRFLEALDCPNVGVNFDPANMLLYDKGDPIAALRAVGPYLKQCHLKDARKTPNPGEWGEEVPVGSGEVDWKAFFRVLGEIGFDGDCPIERETGDRRVEDIAAARDFVSSLGGSSSPRVNSASTVRIGIVGSGFMAATHIRAYREIEGAEIAALCNPSGRNFDGDFSTVAGNLGSGEPLFLDMGNVKTYRDFHGMLADPDLDVVDICSPTRTHCNYTVAALEAGKHVLCEKPVARSAEEARAMARAAERSDGYYLPGMCLRFWPEWVWLKEAVADGRYGKVLAARFRRIGEPPAWGRENYFSGKYSGGALFDLHVHDTDFIQYCFGKPLSVFSSGYSVFSGAVDHVVTQYRVPGGALVYAEGGWVRGSGFGFTMAYTVNFERVTADYDSARAEAPLRVYGEGGEVPARCCGEKDGYYYQLKYFLDCIRSGTRPARVTPEDGVISLAICEAEEESVRSGQVVNLK